MPDFKLIQEKWQKAWEDNKTFRASDNHKLKKFYCLEMFPYPSASFLHMGHVRNFTIGDSIARFKRMQGFNILYPMGYDSFGLPAENASKKAGIHPREYTEDSIQKIMGYQKRLGLSYDWDRMIATHRPEYYRWNQYFFLKFFEKGLAYRKKAAVNYCEHCVTVLANEEVENGKCWRCENLVVQKDLDQWFLKTTAYAEELLNDLQKIEWPDRLKIIQENWIGKSHGIFINFHLDDKEKTLFPIFTTRPDTIYGVTFMVIALNHPKLKSLIKGTAYEENVNKFIEDVKKAETADDKVFLEKSGVFTGLYAINPLNNQKVPIYAGNFVVADYATGMIMAVPAHDQRDFEFAKKYGIQIKIVISEPKKKTVLILHGTEGHSGKNWYPWIKKELEHFGYNVIVPDMPDSDFPEIDKWLKCLEQFKDEIDETSIIIGHSLGAPTAIQFIQKFNKKIDKLFLIGPTHKDINWKDYLKKYPNENTKNIQAVSEIHTDWNKIKEKIKSIKVYVSEDDPYIPLEVKDYYARDIGASIRIFDNKGHFNQSAGVKEFPELLSEILEIDSAFTGDGTLVNSKEFDGLNNVDAIEKISEYIESKNLGKKTVQYKLKDWLISRQRYWGTPIPILYCEHCGTVPISEKELPLLLPEDVDFTKTGNPILTSKTFLHTKCPKCGAVARRETDTMGGFMDSSWYFLRYCSPDTKEMAFDKDAVNYWMPVDQYVGGIEHAVGHLIYSRWFTKVLRDMGFIDASEPFSALFNQGIVYKDGAKMSKSHGNIVTQDEISEKYGIDTARMFVLFIASPDKEMEWSDQGVEGTYKFILRTHKLFEDFKNGLINNFSDNLNNGNNKDKFIVSKRNSIIKSVTNHLGAFKLNSAIISLMEYVNYLNDIKENISKEEFEKSLKVLALLLNPFAPHLSEECWSLIDGVGFSSVASWPEFIDSEIDPTLMFIEQIILSTKQDIDSVLKLAKISNPLEISIIISDSWKYELFKMIKKFTGNQKKDTGAVLKHIMASLSNDLKKHGQDITKIVPKILEKMPEYILDQKIEFESFSSVANEYSINFGCAVNIVKAEESKEQKAKAAQPGKPAIVIK